MYFMQKGITIFRWKKFVSQFEKIRRGNRLCLRKFRVSKNFMPKRGISRFSIKNIVVSQYRKYFVAEPFFVSENFWYRKNLWIRGGRGGGSITIFSRKFLVSQCQNISWASLQWFRKFGVSKNFMHNRGYHVFPSNNDGLTVPKNFAGIASKFQKIWGIEKFYA